MSCLTLSVACGLEELLSIQEDWEELWRSDLDCTPFQSPGWLIPYLQVFRPESVSVLLIRRQHRLIGCFPFWRDDSSGRPVLKILGQGVSDYLDALCQVEERTRITPLIEDWLATELQFCHLAEFSQLRKDAVLRSIPGPSRFCETIRSGVACPALSLFPFKGSGEPAFPPAMKRNTENSYRQAAKIGPVQLDMADNASFDDILGDLFRLHAKRWQQRGSPGVLANAEQQAFCREAFYGLNRLACIKLFRLRIGTAPVAVLVALCQNQVVYYYIGAFDPEYSKFGPGNLIIRQVIEFCAKSGFRWFDFLRGQEAYKYKWGAKDQETYVRQIRLQEDCNSRPARQR